MTFLLSSYLIPFKNIIQGVYLSRRRGIYILILVWLYFNFPLSNSQFAMKSMYYKLESHLVFSLEKTYADQRNCVFGPTGDCSSY